VERFDGRGGGEEKAGTSRDGCKARGGCGVAWGGERAREAASINPRNTDRLRVAGTVALSALVIEEVSGAMGNVSVVSTRARSPVVAPASSRLPTTSK
jgi:hypothetical protein